MDSYYPTNTETLKDDLVNTQKALDEITAMRVECADMELTLTALNHPLPLNKLYQLHDLKYSSSEDSYSLAEVKSENEEPISANGTTDDELENTSINDHSKNLCSEVVANN